MVHREVDVACVTHPRPAVALGSQAGVPERLSGKEKAFPGAEARRDPWPCSPHPVTCLGSSCSLAMSFEALSI